MEVSLRPTSYRILSWLKSQSRYRYVKVNTYVIACYLIDYIRCKYGCTVLVNCD